MSILKNWAMVVSFAFIIAALFEMISPNEKMEKVLRIVLNIFVLIILLFPLKGISNKINLNFKLNENAEIHNEKFQDEIKNQTKKKFKEELERKIKVMGEEEKINIKKVKVFMDINEDNCISIKKIKIFIQGKDLDKRRHLEEKLTDKLRVNIEVVGCDT
ncbi:MAG: stage III sporulation protein AF [Clostridia bacterium]|nr:stage III sporulation protein AF [Clostridia bacterium]